MLEETLVGVAIDKDLRNRSVADCYTSESTAKLITSALLSGGLGQSDSTAPLRDIIKPGMLVLLKPNWVSHINNSGAGNECLVTHPEFIKAVVIEVLKAQPREIIIADAPIQGCRWDEVVTELLKIQLFEIAAQIPIRFVDFRRTIAVVTPTSFDVVRNKRDQNNYVLFDLGHDSLLEPITSKADNFRVACYDPDILAKTHGNGRHQYLIAKELFDADVVINLPKLKTHRKAGMTGALKNLVGINGDKDYLPHHRIGSSQAGGDCYSQWSFIKYLAEKCTDAANRNINKPKYEMWKSFAGLLLRVNSLFSKDNELDGGWYGNDTVWRMVLDLNRIALYGDADGKMNDNPQRKIYSITDGIVAGQGDGPLSPTPLVAGFVSFARSSACADIVHATFMRLDWNKIPTTKGSFNVFNYPITSNSPSDIKLVCNQVPLSVEEFTKIHGIEFIPPKGWKDNIEQLKTNIID